MPKCLSCGSSNVKQIEENGMEFIQCNDCGYNELEEGVVPEQRTSQREKGKYSPYKQGGKGRVRKK